jgi:hypothetical protein
MIKDIPYRSIVAGRNYDWEAFDNDYRHDRKDIYRACSTWDNPATMAAKIYYKIVEVNCNPDIDW